MIKSSLSFVVFLLTLTSVAQMRYELNWKNIETLEFDFPIEEYTNDSIMFYHSMLEKADIEGPLSTTNFSFSEHAKPLDLNHYWEQKNEEQYHVLLTKVAYVLDQSVHFFTEERLADVNFISQTMPLANIKQIDSTYNISVGFGAPEIDYTLHFYTPAEFEFQYPYLKDYFKKYDGLALNPDLIVVQHNYRYGKVMFQETSKMSISISRYFKLSNKQTLVFNYTLNYIHNIPPSFIGGSDYLIEKIKDGIKGLIDETQYICRTM